MLGCQSKVQSTDHCVLTHDIKRVVGGNLVSLLSHLKEGNCRYRPEKSVVKVTRFLVVPRNEEALINALVNIGPIAVGIDAQHESFKKYAGGKFMFF